MRTIASTTSLTVKTDPVKVKEFDGKFGPLVVWKFETDEEGTVELLKKPGNEPPKKGTTVLGEVTSNEFGKRLKLANDSSSFTGNRGGSPEDPIRQRRIVRQHSQTAAISFMAATGSLGGLSLQDDGRVRDALTQLRRLADWLDQDVERAAKKEGE